MKLKTDLKIYIVITITKYQIALQVETTYEKYLNSHESLYYITYVRIKQLVHKFSDQVSNIAA